ncbi:hypothetical protein Tco_0612526 [Tanacetum coccineum]
MVLQSALTGLDYNNGKYVADPAPEVVKKELGKIAINLSYLDKTPVLKNSFLMAWRIMFNFVIHVLSGNYSFTKQVNSIQQLLAYSLITGTEVDIREIIYSDLVTKILNKSSLKYVSYPRDITSMTSNKGTAKTTPRPEGLLGDKDSGGNIPPSDIEPIHTLVAAPSRIGAKYQVDKTQSTRLSDEEEVLAVGDDIDEDPKDDKEVRTPSPKQDQPEPSHVQESAFDSYSLDLKKFDNILPLTERQLIKYLRKMSRVLFNRISEK